jgi:hypothetical protein
MKTFKKSINVVIGLFLIISLSSFTSNGVSNNNNTNNSAVVVGNGKIKTKKVTVEAFSKISILSNVDVVLNETTNQEITILAETNIIELLDFEFINNKLTIKNKNNINFKSTKKIVINIPIQNLETILVDGCATVTSSTKLKTDYIKLIAKNGGTISIDLDAVESDIFLDSNAKLNIKGNVENTYIEVSYQSNFEGTNLMTENATLKLTGSVDCMINCNKSIDAYLCGNGNLKYKGSPKNKNLEIKGTGKIVAMK